MNKMYRFLILFLAVVIGAVESSPLLGNAEQVAKWNEFKRKFGKAYATSEKEAARFNSFLEALKYVEQHNQEFNAGKHSFQVEINKFSDLSNQEFRARMNGYKQPANWKSNAPIFKAPTKATLPTTVDWRAEGYVTPVKDQGSCGSCWAFSATGSLEGQHFNATGKLVSLSEQNLVDCSRREGNSGCSGGWMDDAFQYVKDNNGIDTEDSYPYKAKNGMCKYNASGLGATDAGFVDIEKYNEDDLVAAIATIGPISVAIDASHASFRSYKSGVYYEPHCFQNLLDHGVLAVGYGTTDDGQDYYIVKNSWGTDWGDNGFILMSRGKNNNCGIATNASYPIL